jgi:tetratricopeptide (TPR) repeat protein
MSVGGTDRNPVELLSEEFVARIRRGEAVTPEEYAAKHPEWADEILAVFPALLMMEDLGGETADITASLASAPATITGVTAGRLGEFRLLREVGRGSWASSTRRSKKPLAVGWRSKCCLQSRAGNLPDRVYRCFGSGVLALARGDVAAYRAIAAEGIDRLAEDTSFWVREAVRTAALSPESPIAPEKLVSMAQRLIAHGKNDDWNRVTLGNALFRAGRDKEALAALEGDTGNVNAKVVIALIHARDRRSEQARRWLQAIERDLEDHIMEALLSQSALRPPRYWAHEVHRADLLRPEAYALLSEPTPEVRALRLLRADALWRLRETKQAESELAASVAGAPDEVAALIERARTFEGLGLHDRADADLTLATSRKPDDPRPWVMKGRLLAKRGQGIAADEAYARAAALAPGRLDPFLEAGWWVVGPFVEDMARPHNHPRSSPIHRDRSSGNRACPRSGSRPL